MRNRHACNPCGRTGFFRFNPQVGSFAPRLQTGTPSEFQACSATLRSQPPSGSSLWQHSRDDGHGKRTFIDQRWQKRRRPPATGRAKTGGGPMGLPSVILAANAGLRAVWG